jgi:hypothetical protein
MLLSNNKFQVHTFDIETSHADFSKAIGNYSLKEFLNASRSGDTFFSHSYAKVHARSQLLQLWSSGITKSEGWINPTGPAFYNNRWGGKTSFYVSKFSRSIYADAAQFGKVNEEQSLHNFFSGLEKSLQTSKKPVALTGWNMVYDLSCVESALYRHESLSKYRGFFAKWSQGANPKLHLIDSADNFFNAAWAYGKSNQTFASKHFQGISKASELRNLPGWGIENIARAAGGAERITPGFLPHRAQWNAQLTSAVSEKFAQASELLGNGIGHEEALLKAGLLQQGQTAEHFYSTIFQKVAKVVPEAAAVPKGANPRMFYGGLLVAGAAIVAGSLAFGRRRDRQSQITGLADTGMAVKGRHERSDFGSGWKGYSDDGHTYSSSLRAAGLLTAGYGVNQAHKFALRNVEGYGKGFFNFVSAVENRSPNVMFRTFRFGELASSHVIDEVKLSHSQLFRGGELTPLGATLHRMSGGQVDIAHATEGLIFSRKLKGDPYLHLRGDENFRVRFTAGGKFGSTLAGAAERYGAELHDLTPQRAVGESWWKHLRRIQNPRRARGGFATEVEGEIQRFSPYFGEYGSGFWNKTKAAYNKAATVAFEFAERPQHLLAQMGLGLKQGSYNKLFNVPFVGEGGLVNQMLLKRALPVYLGWQALKYADYKLGHKPSETLADVPIKARVFHAELTDRLPFARSVTDWHANNVPGSQLGPLALPAGGLFLGGMVHYASVLRGVNRNDLPTVGSAYKWAKNLPNIVKSLPKPAAIGGVIGLAAMLPFLPGMLGDRKTAAERKRIYSGEDLIPVKQGRWWDMGSTPWEGSRIKYFKQHWFPRMKAHAEDVSLYGSEAEKWAHNPILHPIKYLKDPYWLEKKHWEDRPYPVTSPAFSDVPLVGPILAATVGKLFKPIRYMHTEEWKQGDDYALYGKRLEPKGPDGLPAPRPGEEFSSIKNIANRQGTIFADFIGMPGFTAKALYDNFFPNQNKGKQTFLQGSRQMTSSSRRYYEKEAGAMLGPNPGGNEVEPYGYSEALRRFIQPEKHIKQVNPLQNKMPSWIPGSDYMVNFHEGDPYASIAEGFARLPGEGYAALHPDLKGVDPEDYSAMEKFKILADVAPYSKPFAKYRDVVHGLAKRDTATRIEYERVMERARQQKESGTRVRERRFSEKTDTIKGTVKSANQYAVELNEFPGRKFTYSSLGMSTADMSAIALGQNNKLTESEVASDVDTRQQRLGEFIQTKLAPGTSLKVTVRGGAAEHDTQARAVFETEDSNINRDLIREGLARERPDLGGAESKAMYGGLAKLVGKYAEGLSFTGDESAVNPLRYVPQPYNTKLWQNRTAIAQYEEQEVYGTRMRRWHRPIHDFLEPYARGITRRLTGKRPIPQDVQLRRDLVSLTDTLHYLRGVTSGYTNESRRTSVGANQFSQPEALTRTLSDHEAGFFRTFIHETDSKKRKRILEDVSPEMVRALTTQWVSKDAAIAKAEGKEVPTLGEGGRLFTKEGLDEYKKAKTQLDYGDFQRSKEIAGLFSRTGFRLPDEKSEVFDPNIDYQDLKLKIIQNEGYDAHDFSIFDDRASLLWRKPYLNGSARELTSGDDRSSEQLRSAVEKMMVNGRNKHPKVRAISHPAKQDNANVQVTVDSDQSDAIIKDAKRNPEKYRSDDDD